MDNAKNDVFRSDVDPEAFGREIGALRPYERFGGVIVAMTEEHTEAARQTLSFLQRPVADLEMAYRAMFPDSKAKRQRSPADLLTAQQAADRLGISIKTLRAHVEAGTLRYVNMGHGERRRRMMFTRSDLASFIEAQARKETAPCPSTRTNARRSTSTTSSSEVIGFTARRNARIAAKLKK